MKVETGFQGRSARTSSYASERQVHAKQQVQDLLDRLPDDCTIDDVLYHLYVMRSVNQGLAEIQAGKGIPHEQVVQELRRKWLMPDAK